MNVSCQPPFGDTQPAEVRLSISVRMITQLAAEYFNLSYLEVMSDIRRDPLVLARHVAMFVAHDRFHISYPRIGRAMGDRDHSTILHGVRKMKAMLEAGSPYFTEAIEAVTAKAMERALRIPILPEDTDFRQVGAGRFRRWRTEDDARLIEIRRTDPHMPPQIVAIRMGRTVQSVLKRALKHNLGFKRWS